MTRRIAFLERNSEYGHANSEIFAIFPCKVK